MTSSISGTYFYRDPTYLAFYAGPYRLEDVYTFNSTYSMYKVPARTPDYHSTKLLYILQKLTRRYINSIEIGGLA